MINGWSVNQEDVLTDGLLMCLYAWWSLEHNRSEVLEPDAQSVKHFLIWLLWEMPMIKAETEDEKEFIRVIRGAVIT